MVQGRKNTHLSTFLEHITVTLVVVAGSASLGIHVWDVIRRQVPFKGGPEDTQSRFHESQENLVILDISLL